MHDMTSGGASGALTQYEVVPVKGGNIREIIPGVSCFRTDKSEGESCAFAMLGMRGGRTGCVFSDSSHCFEQLSCTKFFHSSYGLFYIDFKIFKSFFEFI